MQTFLMNTPGEVIFNVNSNLRGTTMEASSIGTKSKTTQEESAPIFIIFENGQFMQYKASMVVDKKGVYENFENHACVRCIDNVFEGSLQTGCCRKILCLNCYRISNKSDGKCHICHQTNDELVKNEKEYLVLVPMSFNRFYDEEILCPIKECGQRWSFQGMGLHLKDHENKGETMQNLFATHEKYIKFKAIVATQVNYYTDRLLESSKKREPVSCRNHGEPVNTKFINELWDVVMQPIFHKERVNFLKILTKNPKYQPTIGLMKLRSVREDFCKIVQSERFTTQGAVLSAACSAVISMGKDSLLDDIAVYLGYPGSEQEPATSTSKHVTSSIETKKRKFDSSAHSQENYPKLHTKVEGLTIQNTDDIQTNTLEFITDVISHRLQTEDVRNFFEYMGISRDEVSKMQEKSNVTEKATNNELFEMLIGKKRKDKTIDSLLNRAVEFLVSLGRYRDLLYVINSIAPGSYDVQSLSVAHSSQQIEPTQAAAAVPNKRNFNPGFHGLPADLKPEELFTELEIQEFTPKVMHHICELKKFVVNHSLTINSEGEFRDRFLEDLPADDADGRRSDTAIFLYNLQEHHRGSGFPLKGILELFLKTNSTVTPRSPTLVTSCNESAIQKMSSSSSCLPSSSRASSSKGTSEHRPEIEKPVVFGVSPSATGQQPVCPEIAVLTCFGDLEKLTNSLLFEVLLDKYADRYQLHILDDPDRSKEDLYSELISFVKNSRGVLFYLGKAFMKQFNSSEAETKNLAHVRCAQIFAPLIRGIYKVIPIIDHDRNKREYPDMCNMLTMAVLEECANWPCQLEDLIKR